MITHRLETQPPLPPPAHFYKIIAVSFLAVTVALVGLVVFISGKRATLVIVAQNDIRSLNFAVTIEPTARAGKSVAGTVTSTVIAHREIFYPTGNKIVAGVAKGTVIIYNQTALPQPLVKTTRLLTSDGALFRLADRVLVPAEGSVAASVYADQSGVTGDIGASSFTIPGLAAEKQKQIYAESKEPMKGGVSRIGALTAEDIAAAKKIYLEKLAGVATTLTAGKLAAGEKQVLEIKDGVLQTDSQVGAEVSEFAVSGKNTVIMVRYNEASLKESLRREMTEGIDLTRERFIGVGGVPSVRIASVDLNRGTAELAIVQPVTVTLEPSAAQLAPVNFFGKSQAEIERYLLGLPHVASVAVKLSPGWLSTAPSSADKISVVVKQVE